MLFPFAVVGDLHWGTIPCNILVSLSFALISEAGRVLEDPFSLFFNGLPLFQISQMIERNARQRLGDTDLPEVPVQTNVEFLCSTRAVDSTINRALCISNKHNSSMTNSAVHPQCVSQQGAWLRTPLQLLL